MNDISKFVIISLFLLLNATSLNSQGLVINELMASNSSYFDDFGESSDWIELFNGSSQSIELENFGIGDSNDFINCWKFGKMTVGPGEHFLLFASDRNISVANNFRTIIDWGDSWKYLIPNSDLGSAWQTLTYNDNSWNSGSSGFGYGDGDDQTYISSGTRCVFLRKNFYITNAEDISDILLHIDYDDAFIAYINGVEVARANIGTPGQNTPYYYAPNSDHEAKIYSGGVPELFDISAHKQALETGLNVLCIQVHNISSSSSDLSLIPFLTLASPAFESTEVPDILSLSNKKLHTDFKLSSQGENLYLFASDGSIMDSVNFPSLPADVSFGRKKDGNPEWVLFKNPSPENINSGPYYNGTNPDTITYSYDSGIYNFAFSLNLSGSDFIRYTLDGSEPQAYSPLYSTPIFLSKNTLVRANIFEDDLYSEESAQHYLFDVDHNLPIITLNTPSKNLWDEVTGMYSFGYDYEYSYPYFGANFWKDREYPFYITYYENEDKPEFETMAGVKIFGGWSRAFDQKSLSVFARSSYGLNKFEHRFFESRPYSGFESLILRNSGNDWDRSFLRDALMSTLMQGSEVDFQAYQPVVAYVNDEYWGMYNLREKINEHYLASLHQVDPDEIDLIELNGLVKHGSNEEYLELRTFIEAHSLVSEENYRQVEEQMDMVNYIQYQIANIYYDNTDWPGNNIRCWKSKTGKWRWIMYDADFGLNLYNNNGHNNNTLAFALSPNGPDWPNPPWSTLFFRKLTQNDEFKRLFVNYFADALNSNFRPGYAIAQLDALSSNIEDEIITHRNRWQHSYALWVQNLNLIKTFFNQRPSNIRSYIRSTFNLPGQNNLTIQNDQTGFGNIQVNSLLIESSYWSGIYFQDNPITITAFPKPGYRFDHWSGNINSSNPSIELNPDSPKTIKAHFSPIEPSGQPVIINEINYKSPDDPDPEDWVEIHNFSDEPVDISAWVLKDNKDDNLFEIPANSILAPRDYWIISRDPNDFKTVFPDVNNVLGPIDFGLSSGGDEVRLFDNNAELIDSVRYMPGDPWPTEANGKGPSLELLSPELDNSLEGSWRAFPGYGTPGRINHSASLNQAIKANSSLELYPNPARDRINIVLPSRDLDIKNITVYGLSGKFIGDFPVKLKQYDLSLEIKGLTEGQYLLIIGLKSGKTLSTQFEKR